MYFLWNRANKKDKEYRLILKTRKLEDLALRYQMSPHFIKNAINNIQSTLFLKGEKTASKYISNLATMIRFTLYNAGKDRVSLKEELKYLRAYISMEHLRRNGEFDYEIKIEGISDIEKIEFPPMLFQPIVENAILHGLSGLKGEKKIEVKFRKQGNYISGEIIDNGNGFYFGNDDSVDKQESVANKIINQRIEIYNQQIRDYLSFYICRVDNKTIATIKILIVKTDEF
jgi:LytS/YehU family sensor histidine kinase